MFAQFRPALVMLIIMTALTGALYPLVVTQIAQIVMPHQANGSLIKQGDKLVGSELIGQAFSDPKYFWGRPSATSPYPYNAAASSGSNQGPLNPALAEAVEGRVKALRDADPSNEEAIPVDLITASGSGLDPHISPAAAQYQIARIARLRGLDRPRVRQLVAGATEARQLGFFGEPRVNVLKLNLSLDATR
ncbi:MAG: potassium-transporting ATPase KdpC subunit [Betaproteobacteria bacterium]